MTANAGVKGYNAGAMVLHWTIAAAILFQLAAGFAMANVDAVPDSLRFALFQWHKTVGLSILALTLARIAWRLLNPPPPVALSRPERLLSGAVHLLFYGLMLAVPVTGWLLVSASPTRIPTLLFLQAALPWPSLPVAPDAAAADLANTAHIWLAYSFVVLLVLHVAGAIKHAWIDRQPSFSRMLPAAGLARRAAPRAAIPLALGLILLFLAGGVLVQRVTATLPAASTQPTDAAAVAPASGWQIDRAASRLGYEVAFSGNRVSGEIGGWTAAIQFDPDDLAAASARLTIDAATITVSDSYIGSNLAGDDGLQLAAHPLAEVVLDSFEKSGDGFLAKGMLTIRGQSAPIEVPFTFQVDAAGRAQVSGMATFERLAFGLGAQNDQGGDWLGKTVTVVFDLEAQRAPQ